MPKKEPAEKAVRDIRLNSYAIEEVSRVLLAIFEDFFDAVGERRPTGFRGFPSSPPPNKPVP
jgi:hypothetical protein